MGEGKGDQNEGDPTKGEDKAPERVDLPNDEDTYWGHVGRGVPPDQDKIDKEWEGDPNRYVHKTSPNTQISGFLRKVDKLLYVAFAGFMLWAVHNEIRTRLESQIASLETQNLSLQELLDNKNRIFALEDELTRVRLKNEEYYGKINAVCLSEMPSEVDSLIVYTVAEMLTYLDLGFMHRDLNGLLASETSLGLNGRLPGLHRSQYVPLEILPWFPGFYLSPDAPVELPIKEVVKRIPELDHDKDGIITQNDISNVLSDMRGE